MIALPRAPAVRGRGRRADRLRRRRRRRAASCRPTRSAPSATWSPRRCPNLKPEQGHRRRPTPPTDPGRPATDGEGFSAASAEEATSPTEAQLQARIKDIVEGVVGAGKARVQVTADIDHSRVTTQEQQLRPRRPGRPLDLDHRLGERQRHRAGAPTAAPRRPTTSPAARRPATTPAGSTRRPPTTETTNYEISKTTTTEVKEPGAVKQLSVAVAVDGDRPPPAPTASRGRPTPPRTPRRCSSIEQLVRAAVGFDAGARRPGRGDQRPLQPRRWRRPAASDGRVVAVRLRQERHHARRRAAGAADRRPAADLLRAPPAAEVGRRAGGAGSCNCAGAGARRPA